MITNFKYRSGSSALRSLSEGSLYFAGPNELNDILEAKFELAGAAQFLGAITGALNELASKRGLPGNYGLAEPMPQELECMRSTNHIFPPPHGVR